MSNMLTDLRRRYAASSTILQSDEETQKYAMQEAQDALKDINDLLSVENTGLRNLITAFENFPS